MDRVFEIVVPGDELTYESRVQPNCTLYDVTRRAQKAHPQALTAPSSIRGRPARPRAGSSLPSGYDTDGDGDYNFYTVNRPSFSYARAGTTLIGGPGSFICRAARNATGSSTTSFVARSDARFSRCGRESLATAAAAL